MLPVPASQKHTWTKGLTLKNFDDHVKCNEKMVKELKDLSGGSQYTAYTGLTKKLAQDQHRPHGRERYA